MHKFILFASAPNGLRYWRVGCADSLDRQKKLDGRKMLAKPHRTHPSSARFVGLRAVEPDSLAVKDLPAKRLTKLLHETLTFATAKKYN